MNKYTTLTLKIINYGDALDSFPRKELTAEQKALITFVARTAVAEYISQERLEQAQCPQQSSRITNMERILRLPEILEITGLSRSTIYSRMNEGAFPQYVRLGGRSVGWKESEIIARVKKCE